MTHIVASLSLCVPLNLVTAQQRMDFVLHRISCNLREMAVQRRKRPRASYRVQILSVRRVSWWTDVRFRAEW